MEAKLRVSREEPDPVYSDVLDISELGTIFEQVTLAKASVVSSYLPFALYAGP